MIGQWLGASGGERIERLVLANTSARVADPGLFEARRTTVLAQGISAIEEQVMQRFFSARTLASANPMVDSIRTVLLATNPVGYAGCCAAIRDMDHCPLLGSIKIPVLVIAGDEDISTPWAGHGDLLVNGIGGARARCVCQRLTSRMWSAPRRFPPRCSTSCCRPRLLTRSRRAWL